MKYLYIDKRQRIDTGGELPKKVQRLIDEMKFQEIAYDFAYSDTISIYLHKDQIEIKVNGVDITTYSHIFFGGHYSRRDYEIKNIIIDHIDRYNQNTTGAKILVQNRGFIRMMPYYSKMYMAKICIDNNLPHLATYYHSGGEYLNDTNPLQYPMVTKHYMGTNDILVVDGKEKVKKTVFKVENESEWKQERLAEKDLTDYLVQEFTDAGEDLRIFVSNKKVIGGWKRVAGDSFITVNRSEGSRYIYQNTPEPEVVEICEKAAKAWDVDFMALDFIYKNGEPYILEFSMHPGFAAYENKCEDGEPANIADAILHSFPSAETEMKSDHAIAA